MGSKLCVSRQRPSKQINFSPRTSQEMSSGRGSNKLIYPPLSSIPTEERRRSLLSGGRLIYEPVYMKSTYDDIYRQIDNSNYASTSNYSNYPKQYDDGTFAAVPRRHSVTDQHVFRL